MSGVRLGIRVVLSLLWLLLLVVLLLFARPRRHPYANATIRLLAFQIGAALWGIRIRVEGDIAKTRPLLLVSNHFSYLDVFALGALLPARFTPKSEVAGWPFIGFMCRLMRCVFIDRRPSQTLRNREALEQACAENPVISLFPEGTTNEGGELLPFRSALFSLAEERRIPVQPVTIRYESLNGAPLGPEARAIVGWYGDAEFFPHLKHFLRQRYVDVTVIFHDPVLAEEFPSRKALAGYCRAVIEDTLKQG